MTFIVSKKGVKNSVKRYAAIGARKRLGTYRYRARHSRANAMRNLPMVRLGQGFPKKIMVTHKYRDIFNVTSTSGGIGTQIFSCNGMFKPDQTNAGHQPLYFDQMTPLYNHYCVIGSKITWRISPSTSLLNTAYAAVFINDDTVGPATVSTVAEQTTGQFRQIVPLIAKPCVITQKWSAKKYFGKDVLANDELQGTVAANPTEQSYFALGIQVTGNATVSFSVDVEVEYLAIWKEVTNVAAS